jgi:crotonobetainyl-CoA:carnitine CoA-transferase CaiB-like acyl-CoA transferase
MLPLAGVKVIEFCQVLAGPFCGCLLADMGADVIKVESPDGDLMRFRQPQQALDHAGPQRSCGT